MAYVNTGAYDKWLKEQQQQELANSYNAQKAALDNKYNNGGGLGGFLGNIVGGIGKGIGDVGYALGGLFGTAGASVGDLVGGIGKGITTGDWNISDENSRAFKRTYYGAKDDKDAAAKAAGNSLNAATTLATTVIPGAAGAGSIAGKALGGVAANTIGGAIGGVADEFAQQGSDANFESAMNRALSGAAAGAVAGKVGSKIGNAKSGIGKALLNNNIATSTIGRGAISGAVGGATGGATSAALGGGDVLGSAIEGAKSGAISGGVQAGVTSAAKSLVDATAGKAIRNGWDRQKERIANAENQAKPVVADVSERGATTASRNSQQAEYDKLSEDVSKLESSLKRIMDINEYPSATQVVPETYEPMKKDLQKQIRQARTRMKELEGLGVSQKPIEQPQPEAKPTRSQLSDEEWSGFSDPRNIDVIESGDYDLIKRKADQIKMQLARTKERYEYPGPNEAPMDENVYKNYTKTLNSNLRKVNAKLKRIENLPRPDTNTLDTLNPTGTVQTEYDPTFRASAPLGNDLTTYNVTAGIDPNNEITIYRGVPEGVDTINAGDYITTNPQLAKDYAGNGRVISQKVKASDIVDSISEPMGEEYIYRPSAQPVVEAPVEYEEPVLPNYTTPIDYQGNELKIRNKNLLEKAGGILSGAGESIKNADVYNSLYSKTANRVTRNDSINKLRQLGFEPDNYAEAAKISTTTNKFVDDIVKNSGATVTDNKFAEKIMTPDDNIIISDPTYLKKYNTKVRQLLDRIETGDYPGQYKASDLLKESRQFGEWANDLRKKSTNVNGDVTNRDGYELADAYTDVKYALRDLASQAVDGFGDNYTKSQLSERLTKLGAPKEAINYMLEADDIGGFIRNTSLFEDARQMAREMEETKVRRNAVAGSSTNPATIALNAAGVPQLLKAGLTPIGKVSGGLAKGIGETMQSIGSRLPEGGQSNLTPQAQLLLGNYIGRTQGLSQANQINTEAQKARDYQNLEQLLMEAQATEMPEYQQQPSANAIKLQSQINQTSGMMEQALAMGDLSAYSKLQTVYNQLVNAYKNEMPSIDNGMTVSQKNKLAKLQNASDALDQLSQLYSNAGGAQGITGNVANWLSGVGLNDNLNNYNKSVKTLINQISSAIGSSVSSDLIPKVTDSEAEAQNKIETLRQLIAQASGNYNQIYGA